MINLRLPNSAGFPYSARMTLHAVPTPTPLDELLLMLARLRHPITGSPWERDQSCASIAPNTLEEAYEVVDAISRNDMQELKGELGDLLLQVVFHSQIAKEGGHFTFDDVAQGIVDKIKRRLPHFFAGRDVTVEKQLDDWEAIKAAEKAAKGHDSIFDDIPLHLPALVRANKLQNRATRMGFSWNDISGVYAKIDEELAEVKEAAASGDRVHLQEELGDLLVIVSRLANVLGYDAEQVLREGNRKYEKRLRHMESRLKENGEPVNNAPLDKLMAYWADAKLHDHTQPEEK